MIFFTVPVLLYYHLQKFSLPPNHFFKPKKLLCMKKSSTYVILLSCFKKWISPVSFFTILVLLFSGKTQAQSSDPFSRQNQFDFKIFLNPQVNLNPQAFTTTQATNQQAASPVWENIQSVVIDQPVGPYFSAKPVTLNLDQVRNGSGTSPVVPPNVAPWVNGNAGASNAHYAEGWSIPYRCVIENLPVGSHSLDIEWDTRQSSSSAIDFVTNYDLIDFPAGSHVNSFGHVQEVINPLPESGSFSSGNATVIPTPSFTGAPGAVTTYYNIIMASSNTSGPANKFSIWNGNITNMSYINQANTTAASGSSSIRIFFTNTASTVIISWGGHIAKGPGVWGDGNSAAAVSGSPYHTRLLSWDPDGDGLNQTSVGNTDRSLSADAVLDPPVCDLNGPSSLECASSGTFTSGVESSDLGSGVSYEWSVFSSTCGTNSVTLSNQSVGSVTATVSGCSCSFVLRYKLLKNSVELSHCDKTVLVSDHIAPTLTCANPTSTSVNCPTTPESQFVAPTATDACSTPTVTSSDATTPGSCASNYTVTRTWTARDACGNTATCSRSVTVQDINAPTITAGGTTLTLGCNPSASDINGALGTATATDGCVTPTVTAGDGQVSSSTCSRSQTRTFTARDACGNTSTTSRTVTWISSTPPVFTSCPDNIVVECGSPTSSAAIGSATATDACGSVTTTASDVTTPVACQTVITRTWTARDACGNTATCVQRILVIDRTAPVITCNPDGSATATDCGSYFLYKNGTKWTAIDGSGNISTANCPVQQGARIVSSQVTSEQKEQTTVSEEKTKAKTLAKAPVVANDVKVNTVPNPFNDRVKFVVTSPQAGYGTLEVMNVLGQKVKTVYQGHINAGEQSFEMSLPVGRYSTLFYILRINGKQVTGKLVQRD